MIDPIVRRGSGAQPARRDVLIAGAATASAAMVWPGVGTATPADAALALRRAGGIAGAAFAGDWQRGFAFSPLSAGALALLLTLGTSGRTRAALGDVLGIGTDTGAVARDLGVVLASLVPPGARPSLRQGHGIWTRGVPLLPKFEADVLQPLRATTATLPGDPTAAAEALNAWVNTTTDGQIPRVLARVEPDVDLVVASACAFSATWARAFSKDATIRVPFQPAIGQPAPVAMMTRPLQPTDVSETHGMIAVRLPYADDRYDAVAMMPMQTAGERWPSPRVDELLAGLSFIQKPMRVELPKLDLAQEVELLDLWKAGALAPLFAADADFSLLRSAPVRFDRVVHRVRLQVDEAGTVAAAATVALGTRSHTSDPIIRFDRPFLFAVVERATTVPVIAAFVAEVPA